MDLNTQYLGLQLRSPLVASASPLSSNLTDVRRAVDGGIGAVVMYSLFEEQVRAQELEDLLLTESHADAFGEATDGYFPDASTVMYAGVTPHLRQLERLVAAVDVPVIASLNGASPGGWTAIAADLESAGAAALELNIYAVPGASSLTGTQVEQAHLEILSSVLQRVSIPVSVKLSPFFSATAAMATALDAAGAAGLVLFNRFLQPDVDTETLQVVPRATLSVPGEARLPRTWIAILRNQVSCSLAATTGVDSGTDVAAYLLAGADVVMTASALLRHGPEHAAVLLQELQDWMERKGFDSPGQMRGLLAVAGATDQRAGYLAALESGKRIYGDLRR